MGPINTITGRPLSEEQAARDYQVRGMGNVTQGLLPGPGFIDRADAELGNAMRTAQVNPAGAVDTVSQYTVPLVLPQGLKTKVNPNVLAINYEQAAADLLKQYGKIQSKPKLVTQAKNELDTRIRKVDPKFNASPDKLVNMRDKGYKEILHAYGQVPTEILDPIKQVGLFEEYMNPIGRHTESARKIQSNPWMGTPAGSGVFHEINHDVLKAWGNSTEPLKNWHKLTKSEQERVLRSRILTGLSEEMKATAAYKGVNYSGSKFYTSNPIEREARAFEKWYLKAVRGKKKPTVDQFYDRFDKHQKILMQNLKKQAPETWKNFVVPQMTKFREKLGLKDLKASDITHGIEDAARQNAPDSIKRFTNTQDAVAFGEKASPRQHKLLNAARERALAEAELAKGNMDYQKWMDLSTDAQFYREALEGAKGKHPLQRKKK